MPNFWQRQFRGPRTLGSDIFDIVFGVVLPIVCLVVDPGVMNGRLSIGPLTQSPLIVYSVITLTMLAVIGWLAFGGRWSALDSLLAGILFAGGGLAFALGLSIAPFSVIGLFVLIGALGFVPFFTAFVCFRCGTRALANRPSAGRAIAAAAVVATFAVAFGYQSAADFLLDDVVEGYVHNPDPGARALAAQRLEVWRVLIPRREFARRGLALRQANPGDPRGQDYEFAYQQITGTSIWQSAQDAD